MKLSFISVFLLTAGVTQAQVEPYKAVQLSLTDTHEHFLNRPLSATDGPVGWNPNSSQLFVGFQLPDGRIRVGGVDTWLTIDQNQLVVASAREVGPANFDVKNGTLYFANSNKFKIINFSGDWFVFTINATFPTTTYRGPAVKIAVRYY